MERRSQKLQQQDKTFRGVPSNSWKLIPIAVAVGNTDRTDSHHYNIIQQVKLRCINKWDS
jgi:hypothetical protein